MAFRWEDIDHSLAKLRLLDLSIEMNRLIKADERRIRFEQLGNSNRNTVRGLILQMQQNRADEWVQKTYDIYCDVWQKQGNAKSAAFLRAVFTHGIWITLRARAGAIASEFSRYAVGTAFPAALTQAHMRSLDLKMQRLESNWHRRIEIAAKECEHAERVALQSGPAKDSITQIVEPRGQNPSATQGFALGRSHNLASPRPDSLYKPLMLRYRSGIKRAILGALIKNPTATSAQICRSLDADGGEELPTKWRIRKESRSFFDAYSKPQTRRRVETTISKVRMDLRDRKLLE